MQISNKRWSTDYFFEQRKRVLSMWPTGNGVSLTDAFAYHHAMNPLKNASNKAMEAKRKGLTLMCPSTGKDTISAHTNLLKYMQDEAKVQFVTTYIDSLTRNCKFDVAKQELQKANETGKPRLNGFPVVEHGVMGNRAVIDALDIPVLLFGPTPDARLTHEIGLAGGHTGYSGGPLISFWNYTKNVPVESIIHNFQYINRLMGHYEENGVPMMYCVSGAMPATSPPSIMVAPEIIEVLIAAAQGVKHVQLNCWVQGHFAQDLAMILTFQKLTREYLDRFGFTDVKTTTYSVSPTGRFPVAHDQVYGLIAYYAVLGVMGKVQLIGSRTIDEAHHIPTIEGTAHSFRCAGMVINMLQNQNFNVLDNPAVKEEAYYMEIEVRAILDKVLELGSGDIVLGTKLAIEQGVLDQPYSTSQLVKSMVLGVKDCTGAARFYDFGNLPFDSDIKAFHLSKIAEREKQLGCKVDYETVVKDLTAVSEGYILPEFIGSSL